MSKSKLPAGPKDEVDDESCLDPTETKRRKALGRIVATTGIVATMSGDWKKPVLTSAVLPAHADATCPGDDSGDDTGDSDCPDEDVSDMRMKMNIRKLDSAELGFQLYRFEYRADPDHKTYVGVMAQHLEETHPSALIEGPDGLYRVDYGSLGLKMTTLEEWHERGIAAVKVH